MKNIVIGLKDSKPKIVKEFFSKLEAEGFASYLRSGYDNDEVYIRSSYEDEEEVWLEHWYRLENGNWKHESQKITDDDFA